MKGRINERIKKERKKNKEGENKLRKETWKRIWQHESRFTSNKTHFFCNFDSELAFIKAHNAMKFSDFLGNLIEIFGT